MFKWHHRIQINILVVVSSVLNVIWGTSVRDLLKNRDDFFKAIAATPTVRDSLPCGLSRSLQKIDVGSTLAFTSPNYPDNYPSSEKCGWRFQASDEDAKLMVSCSSFHLQTPNAEGKCRDFLQLNDGEAIHKFCSRDSPSTPTIFSTSSNVLNANFKSNANNNYPGFSCIVTAVNRSAVANAGSTIVPSSSTKNLTVSAASSRSCRCGSVLTNVERDITNQKIVGGGPADVGEYPWIAALVKTGTNTVFCGASVINNQWLLTAAHCTQAIKDNKIRYQVLLGAHDLSASTASTMRYNSLGYVQHENYNSKSTVIDNDIALVLLENPLDFSAVGIRPICPPNPSHLYPKEKAIVTGWGTLSSDGPQAKVLQEVEVPTMTNSVCKESYGSRVTANMICAGLPQGGKDACQGDSGGPLISTAGGSAYSVIGIVSWGDKCAEPNKPGVYTRVSKYLQWIASKVGNRAITCPP